MGAGLHLEELSHCLHLDRLAVQRLQALPRQQAVAVVGVLLLASSDLFRQLGGQLVGQSGESVQDADDLALYLDRRHRNLETGKQTLG